MIEAWNKKDNKTYPVTGLHFFEGGKLTSISIDTEEGEKQDLPIEDFFVFYIGKKTKYSFDEIIEILEDREVFK